MPTSKNKLTTAPGTKAVSEVDSVRQSAIASRNPERDIGIRIKEKREALGLNFEEFAALTREYDPEGISAVTLRRYERRDEGRSFPDLRALRVLVDALGESADYLITGLGRDSSAVDRWKRFKGMIKEIAHEDSLPDQTGERWGAFERSEKLNRARLHTKAKG